MTEQLDRDLIAEAFSEFETEHEQILEAETRDIEDLIEEVTGREARFTKAVVLEEHTRERLSGILADVDWERRRALRRLRERLR